jgi:D-3-phosphoglycerate dehydrogenase
MLEQEIGELAYHSWKPNGRAYREDELTDLLEKTAAEALITEHDQVSGKVIDRFPHLQFIGVCRGTPSNVDLKAASRHGIPVFFTPARNAQAVAEMFIANVITFDRNTIAANRWLKEENWAGGAHDSYLQFKGFELAGKTIGMVGFGAIGQRIAQMVRDFPCKINFYDPYIDSPDPAWKKTTLEEVFRTSDVVSIHLPANDQTRDMIDGRLIGLMKPTALFVNTSRAMVVVREDLLRALEEGKIRGAILDVFDHEPPDETDYKIIQHPGVLATPHIAGATFEVEDHHAEIMNNNLLNWYSKRDGSRIFIANRDAVPAKQAD